MSSFLHALPVAFLIWCAAITVVWAWFRGAENPRHDEHTYMARALNDLEVARQARGRRVQR